MGRGDANELERRVSQSTIAAKRGACTSLSLCPQRLGPVAVAQAKALPPSSGVSHSPTHPGPLFRCSTMSPQAETPPGLGARAPAPSSSPLVSVTLPQLQGQTPQD